MEARLRRQAEEAVRRKWHLPKEAEVEFHEVKSKPCKHYFIQKTAQWIECKKCHWGLQMSVGDTLNDGHLYFQRKKVV